MWYRIVKGRRWRRGWDFHYGGQRQSCLYWRIYVELVPPATSVPRPSWTIPLDKISAGVVGVMDNIVPAQGLASIDPYYSTISLPTYAVSALYSKVSKAAISSNNPSRYTVPCDSKIQVKITFGGKEFSLDPRDAITKEGDTCYGTIEIGQGSIFKIGSPFLRNVYTTFGATFSGKDANFTVAFANRARTAPDAPSTGAQTGAAKTLSSSGLSLLFWLLAFGGISSLIA